MGKDLIGDLSIGLRAIDWFAWLNQWRMKRNLNNNVSRSLDQLPKAFKRLSLCVSWNERDSFCASVTIAKNKNVSQLCSLFSLTSVWMNLTISNQIKASLLSRRQSAAFIKTSTTTVHNPTIGCVGAGNTGEIFNIPYILYVSHDYFCDLSYGCNIPNAFEERLYPKVCSVIHICRNGQVRPLSARAGCECNSL